MKPISPFRFAQLLLSFHKKELSETDETVVRETLNGYPDLQKLNEELKDKETIRLKLDFMSAFDTEKAIRQVRRKNRTAVSPLSYWIAAAVLLLGIVSSVYFLVPKPEKQPFYSAKLEKEGTHVTLKLADGQLLRLDTLSTYNADKQIGLQNTNGVLKVTDKQA